MKMFSKMLLAFLVLSLMATPAFAQGGLQAPQNFFTSVQGILMSCGVAVITISIIWLGYQMAFQHKQFAEIAPKFIGAFLIGSAPTIASFFFGAGG